MICRCLSSPERSIDDRFQLKPLGHLMGISWTDPVEISSINLSYLFAVSYSLRWNAMTFLPSIRRTVTSFSLQTSDAAIYFSWENRNNYCRAQFFLLREVELLPPKTHLGLIHRNCAVKKKFMMHFVTVSVFGAKSRCSWELRGGELDEQKGFVWTFCLLQVKAA